MKQQAFEREHKPLWAHYRALLDRLETPRRRRASASGIERFPHLYRQVCGHYALARSRRYSPGLTEDLHAMVQRGYRALYRRRVDWPRRGLSFLATEFPRTLRRHAAVFWLACVLFFGPMAAMGWGCYRDGALIYSLLDTETISGLESMYDPTNRKPGRETERQSDTDFAMFGYYIRNNVGIAFRTFAGGMLLGIGSVLILGFNGLVIGAAGGHLSRLGYGETFWPFVSGHSALELTAIAVAGAAGLLLAAAVLAPGRRRRVDALRENAREAVRLVTGALAMLVLAAAIEAFWSAESGVATPTKYLFGTVLWLLVALYLTLAGRGARNAP
jgi:uncharacterized membrane protein SpoIIM required for sporulation